ncbi:beta-1,4-mannosyltransferase [Amylostereum chailletii]|nr:beta-1,4-mannosyltransferase [Amylostereum chailletii]
MYHAESFAKLEFETFVVGYDGATPVPSLLSMSHVQFFYLAQLPALLRVLPFLLLAPLKIAHQICTILHTLLWRIPYSPEFIVVQNPPSIPTLALVALVSALRGSKVIIDWHNLGYSILALKLGPKHPLVRLAERFESTFGQKAFAHLFVTQAMRDHLVKAWNLQGLKAVLHDRPPAHFRRSPPSEVHQLFVRLAPSLPTAFLPTYHTPFSTPFTSVSGHVPQPSALGDVATDSFANSPPPEELSMPELRQDRPALVVSSTSWTPDEDFGILLDALAAYEARARVLNGTGGQLPKMLMVVTGKGPDRARYMEKVGRMQRGDAGAKPWAWVRCVSLWLEAEDYPVLLGSADVGVSLHASSSALDLPMKVVDMFGCGLPVCALDFACLPELVRDGKNGLVFKDAHELAGHLETLLTGFPKISPMLGKLRAALEPSPDTVAAPTSAARTMGLGVEREWGSWDQNWGAVVRPLLYGSRIGASEVMGSSQAGGEEIQKIH